MHTLAIAQRQHPTPAALAACMHRTQLTWLGGKEDAAGAGVEAATGAAAAAAALAGAAAAAGAEATPAVGSRV